MRMTSNTASLFKRHEAAHEMMLRATMPTTGIVEFDNLLTTAKRTGRVWRNGNMTLVPVGTHYGRKEVR